MTFKPTRESVNQHALPDWYDDAKLGLFIHWSLFSVPAFAPFDGTNLADMMEKQGFAYAMKNSPYAEWYLNSLRIDGSPTKKYHNETFGADFSYFNFQKDFEAQSADLDMGKWADAFLEYGVKYVVIVTKHHDGYCLWPSQYKNPFNPDYQSKRDLVGELAEAVRARGMKFGVYYSGLLDWTFKTYPISDDEAFLRHRITSKEYTQYSLNQIHELIERYKPDVFFNDIGFPAGVNLNQLFADYYNEVPQGVVNNRWRQFEIPEGVEEEAAIQAALEETGSHSMDENMMDFGNHCDYVTPEYIEVDEIQKKKFESTRGVGLSFGYNKMETEAEMLTSAELLYMLIDLISKNGNLLINIGPMANGTIPEMQGKPLRDSGDWLKRFGAAVYGTRPWKKPTAVTADDKRVRFTCNGDTIYAIVLDDRIASTVTIKDWDIDDTSKIELMGCASCDWTKDENDVTIQIPEGMQHELAYVFRVCKK